MSRTRSLDVSGAAPVFTTSGSVRASVPDFREQCSGVVDRHRIGAQPRGDDGSQMNVVEQDPILRNRVSASRKR
jgi:hypothetical protein